MNGFHILIFDEDMCDGFLGASDYPYSKQNKGNQGKKEEASTGFGEKGLLSNLPLWANFRIHDLITHCYPDNVPVTIFSLQEKNAVTRLSLSLHKGEIGENIVIGRTGNVTAIDWQNLENRVKSYQRPLKIQVGKVPSDLYVIKRSYLRRVMKHGEESGNNIAKWLFDIHLFHNFERIVDVPGLSFLMRNTYEYFRENMRIFEYMKFEDFLELYKRLVPGSHKNTTVLENGIVKDSILGRGVTVDGIIENSVISDDVTVSRGAVIKDSVILNSNVIEEDVRIENALLFEGNGRVIGSGSVVGSGESIDNFQYPETIKRGLTVIGGDIPVPPFSRIGAGCLVLGSDTAAGNPILVSDGEVFESNMQDQGISTGQ